MRASVRRALGFDTLLQVDNTISTTPSRNGKGKKKGKGNRKPNNNYNYMLLQLEQQQQWNREKGKNNKQQQRCQQHYQQHNYNGHMQKGYNNNNSGKGKNNNSNNRKVKGKTGKGKTTSTAMTSTATSAAKRATTHLAAGTITAELISSMVSITIFDSKTNHFPMLLPNVFRITTFNDDNHSNTFSMFQHQVPSSKTSAPSMQTKTAFTWLISPCLSST